MMPCVTNASYNYKDGDIDLTLTVLINGQDTSDYSENSPLELDSTQINEVKLQLINDGVLVHLTSVDVDFVRSLWVFNWPTTIHIDVDKEDEDGDGQEGFDIPAGTSRYKIFWVFPDEVEQYGLKNLKWMDVKFHYENIPDITLRVYVNFV